MSHVCSGTTPPEALPPTVAKDAAGTYDKTYAWTITKEVDKTEVHQAGGEADFNYTVKVSHDAGTISNVKVSGTITVTNPDGAVIDSITDKLSDGTGCAVTGTSYECDLAALPADPITNTVTIA